MRGALELIRDSSFAICSVRKEKKMKTRHLLISLTLGLGLALALLWLLNTRPASVTAAPAAELHVCPSGCTYASVQAAVDAAGDGDVIKVAAGTCGPATTSPPQASSPRWCTSVRR
jgi:pectin methylesterase-like acyl-CoA thioesterase